MEGITLYMQPVQDLTVEDRVSRTQYQFTLEDADRQGTADLERQDGEKLKTLPQELRDDRYRSGEPGGAGHSGHRSRHDASRMGVLPGAPSTTLFTMLSAERHVSIMFTQLNQYHVVLEVDPPFQPIPMR